MDITNFVKLDEGKLEWHLLPWDALEYVVRVYMAGKKIYEEDNWRKGCEYKRLFNSAMRHLLAWRMGQDIDEDSKCPHLAAVVFACLCLMHFQKEKLGVDDRRKVLVPVVHKVCVCCRGVVSSLDLANFKISDNHAVDIHFGCIGNYAITCGYCLKNSYFNQTQYTHDFGRVCNACYRLVALKGNYK